MEHIFPIRCNVLEDSPHVDGDHQRDEIQKQRVVLVDSPDTRTPATQPPPPSPSPVEGPSRKPSQMAEPPPLVYTSPSMYGFLAGRVARGEVAHGVISGEPDSFAFTRCEDEPIHTPGAIQSHGMLIGVTMVEGRKTRYICCVVSENSEQLCRYPPGELLGLDLIQLLAPSQRAIFQSKALEVKLRFLHTHASSEPEVFPLDLVDPIGRPRSMWCAMHFVGPPHNLLLCEFEPGWTANMLEHISDLPLEPVNTLDRQCTDPSASFESKSEPLNLSSDASSFFRGQGLTMDAIHIISRIQQQLSAQTEVQALLDVIVGLIKELTGYHRIMVYRFDEDFHGEVLAEIVDPCASKDIFKGIHFPASDIPKQARDLYQRMRVRVLFDRLQETSRLTCRPAALLDTPLDLTCSYLRALSPVHLQYASNMGIRSSMSISLNCKGKLWGLICCLSYGPTGFRVPFPLRELCSWFGLTASDNLERLLLAERFKERSVVDTIKPVFDSGSFFSTSSAGLLQLFKAEFGFLVIRGEARTIGRVSSHLEAVTLLRYVCFRNFGEIFATKNITKQFTDLVYEPSFTKIAGLLCIPLSENAGDFLIFFRPFQETEVQWAGNPNVLKLRSSGILEPRNSFKKWIEKVKGNCEPWTEEQFEAAALTRLVYGNFIRVWRDKEAALHETRMKRLLMVNLSHEIRTPLNAVINYLEMASERIIDPDTKEFLRMSQSASKSVIFVLDELLHLTGAVKHQPTPLVHIPFDLWEDVRSTLDPLRDHARRKNLTFETIQDMDFPQHVLGDPQRLQQSLANLVENAIQHTKKGGILVHLGVSSNDVERCLVRLSVQDTGVGLSDRDLDNIFQEFEQMAGEELEDRASEGDPPTGFTDNRRKESHMGVGLAVVARYVKNAGGQIRGSSKLGRGSTFTIEVPFQLVEEYGAFLAPSTTVPSVPTSLDYATPESGFSPKRRQSSGRRFPSTPSRFKSESDMDVLPEITVASSLHRPHLPRELGHLAEMTVGRNVFKILVADDNSVNCAVLKRRLSRIGHEVTLCRDGQQCVEEYQQHREAYDFILMDINMPVVDGVQATQKIRIIEQAEYTHQRAGSSPAVLSPSEARDSRESSGYFEKACEWPPTPSPSAPAGHGPATATTGAIHARLKSLQADAAAAKSDFPNHHPRSVTEPRFSSNRVSGPTPGSGLRSGSEPPYPEGSYFPYISKYPPRRPTARSTGALSPLRTSHLPPGPLYRRIPIFAVSANLDRHSQASLEEAGFDGWLHKPVDFTRLAVILRGTFSKLLREEGKYSPLEPRAGGWFRV